MTMHWHGTVYIHIMITVARHQYLDDDEHLDKVESDTADSTTPRCNSGKQTTTHQVAYPVEQEAH